jgi:hypothetical protein
MKVMFLNEKGRQGRLWKPNEGDAFEWKGQTWTISLFLFFMLTVYFNRNCFKTRISIHSSCHLGKRVGMMILIKVFFKRGYYTRYCMIMS